MKIILQDNNNFVLRFDKGDEVITGLAEFMKSQKVGACSFSGIGAASEVAIGFYNPFLKNFRQKPYAEELEIISLNGTGALKAGQPAIHAHGMFGRNDFSTLGGHVFKLVVSATCEISLKQLNGEMKREPNTEVNLDTLV